MLKDIRYAFRTLRQNPGFAATAIISIALAIGANSAIFSMADGLLLRPMPVPDASRIVSIRARMPSGNFGNLSYPDFVDFRDKSRSFDGLLAYDLVPAGFANNVEMQPQLKTGYLVSGNFFQVLRIEPHLGRAFRPEEDQVPGRDAVVVLSYDLWKSEFGGDPSVIGRQVRLNDLDFVVISVLPESFTGIDHLFRPAFYIPIAMGPKLSVSNQDLLTNRSRRAFFVKGSLAGGISVQAAGAEIAAIAKSLEESNPATNHAIGAIVRTENQLRMELDPGESETIAFLFTLVTIVLLIACANVANLMLNRGRARGREIAVRLAIGANRRRIVRQLMVESLVIALAGGALGLILTEYAVTVFSGIQVPGDLPIQFSFTLDYRVLAFTLIASMLSAILFGLTPALQTTRGDLAHALKAGESDPTRKRLLGRRMLVVVQITGSVVLVLAAAQLYRGLEARIYGQHGFRIDHRITMRFAPTEVGYTPQQAEQFYRTLIQRARDLSGVKSAALSARLPMTSGGASEAVIPEQYEFPAGQESARIFCDYVSDSYFETFGVPIVAGRGFLPTDRSDSPLVAVVNEQFARHFFGGNPVGKRLRIRPDGPWIEVVGMTITGRYFSVFEPPIESMYLPSSQYPQRRMTLIAETYGAPDAMSVPLRDMVRSIDRNMPIFSVRTMEDLFDQRSVKIAHLFTGIVALLGAMGLVLALIGLYAVVSYQVARRTREIGIRVALGAARQQVLGMVLKNSAVMAVTGVCIGTVLNLAASQMLSRGILGALVMRLDPASFVLLVLALLATTLLAAGIPARNASRIDPQKALRQE
jgi:macrolide transport system ATP-binding/permease protein